MDPRLVDAPWLRIDPELASLLFSGDNPLACLKSIATLIVPVAHESDWQEGVYPLNHHFSYAIQKNRKF